jgi:hypothetical protein
MLLSNDLVEGAWPQPVGQRRMRRRYLGRGARRHLVSEQISHRSKQ